MNKTLWTSALALSLSTACTDDAAPMEPMPESPDMPQTPDTPTDTPTDTPPALKSGELDPTFGADGVLALPLGGYAGDITAQGNLLVACVTQRVGANFETKVTRLGLDGAIDTTFGANGYTRLAMLNTDVTCSRVYSRADGSLVVLLRAGSDKMMVELDSNGSISQSNQGLGGPTFAGLTLHGGALLGTQLINSQVQVLDLDTQQMVGSSPSIGSVDHVFRTGSTLVVPGTYTRSSQTGWSVLAGPVNGLLELAQVAVASAGAPATTDLLHDSVLLADGSVFAVGGVDTDLAVMTAHLGAGKPVVETHVLGETSVARRVVLDGLGRPVVVGSATIGGVAHYMWQRYDAATLTVDATYGGIGIMSVPAVSGSGELVSAARVGGGIYALASFDVETESPMVGLVKIME